MMTFEKMLQIIDATHKDVAGQMARKADDAGWDKSDVNRQREGERMVDTITILSIVGKEFDELKARIDSIEGKNGQSEKDYLRLTTDPEAN